MILRCHNQWGANNTSWKGDDVSYKTLHQWVARHTMKPDLCPNCHSNRKLELANVSGKYKRDLNDWEYLCRRCHYEKYHKLYKIGFKCIICGGETQIDERHGTARWCRGRCVKCQNKYYRGLSLRPDQ